MKNVKIEICENEKYGLCEVVGKFEVSINSLEELFNFLKSKNLVNVRELVELYEVEEDDEFFISNLVDGSFEDDEFVMMLGDDRECRVVSMK